MLFLCAGRNLKLVVDGQETLGYVEIPVVDVVNNKRMNQKFHLIDSKNGKIQIELEWQTVS